MRRDESLSNHKSLFLALFAGVCSVVFVTALGSGGVFVSPANAQVDGIPDPGGLGDLIPPGGNLSDIDPADLQNSPAFQDAFPNGLPDGFTLPDDFQLPNLPSSLLNPDLSSLAGNANAAAAGAISQAACSISIPSCTVLPDRVTSDYCDMRENILEHIGEEFTNHRNWFSQVFLPRLVVPALQRFTEQMTASAMLQTFSIGTFFDAKHQLETQRLFQELQFQAHKDYQPSREFCTIGTAVRSMAHTESAGRYTALAFSRRQMARHLGNKNAGGASNDVEDKINRWTQFKENYCDPQDNNWIGVAGTGLTSICGATGGGNTDRINIDVDYTRLVENKRTLNVFAPLWIGAEDEIDILSLGNNLYGHDLITRDISAQNVKNEELAGQYFKLRSIAAKRSVAENSFNAIIGMKSLGSTIRADRQASNTKMYLGRILQDLGIPENEVVDYLGLDSTSGSINAANADLSHFAQLEILAKKIYQNPNFYAGLYDTPANIKRKSAALKAIELMLDRAIYESQLRQEMSMSVLLSTRLQSSVDSVSSQLGAQ